MKILILAAGRGSRFKNLQVPKIFANFGGIRVIDLIIKKALSAQMDVCVMLNEQTYQELKEQNKVKKFVQNTANKYGTGAAVQEYLAQNKDNANGLLIMPGDLPLIEQTTLEQFQNSRADIVIGVTKTPDGPENYGRIIEKDGKISAIKDYRDHAAKTEYVNTGIMYLSAKALALVKNLQVNVHGEVFLTDIVKLGYENGLNIQKICLNADETLGFNTIEEYTNLLKIAQQKWRVRAQASGAVFLDIDSVFISYDTHFEAGCVIEPYCRFGQNVLVKSNAIVKSFSYLENCVIDGIVGPFVHIKSGTIENMAQVGAFVEVKNSNIGEDAKIKHLAYIGDAEIGKKVNIGAGVVVCNYDGKNKHRTKIEDNAFVGANSSLIAPIIIEEGAFLAAGGTYTDDVAQKEFSIARARQINKKQKDPA